jgi:hypothetical protein
MHEGRLKLRKVETYPFGIVYVRSVLNFKREDFFQVCERAPSRLSKQQRYERCRDALRSCSQRRVWRRRVWSEENIA